MFTNRQQLPLPLDSLERSPASPAAARCHWVFSTGRGRTHRRRSGCNSRLSVRCRPPAAWDNSSSCVNLCRGHCSWSREARLRVVNPPAVLSAACSGRYANSSRRKSSESWCAEHRLRGREAGWNPATSRCLCVVIQQHGSCVHISNNPSFSHPRTIA